MTSQELDNRQSTLIKSMRFPLIVLVVFAHSLGFELPDVTNGTAGLNIYHFVSEMISHNFARIAVCWFYVFSGYLFFRYMKEDRLEWVWYANKLKKRFWSLLIPYLIWNLLLVLLSYAKTKATVAFGFPDDGGVQYLKETGPAFWFWTGPINFPLYFMRDLMVMSLLAPLLYYVFKGLRRIGGAVLLLALMSLYAFTEWMPDMPGIDFRSLVFFSVGAYLGIYKLNMLELARKVKWPSAILAAILLVAATLANAKPFHTAILYWFFPFGMITLMNICDALIDNERRCVRMCRMAETVFFVFASHEIFILGLTKGVFSRVFGDGLPGLWISYFGVPVVVLSICLLLYWCIKKIMPRTLSFICGGRVAKKS